MIFKKVAFLTILFWVVLAKAQNESKYPCLPKSAKRIQDLVPKDWKILSQTSGDLNGDGYEDFAFAVQRLLPESIEYDDGNAIQGFQTHPRILGIYFGKRNRRFKKVLQSNSFIINRNTPKMDEPFQGVQILENGILQIDFQIWLCRDCSSWSSHEYQFKHQNKAFELIAYTEGISERVSGDEVDHTIDFQRRTLKIIKTTVIENDEREYEEELKNFELKQFPTLKSLGVPFNWHFLELRI
jgi:hypothetical protein